MDPVKREFTQEQQETLESIRSTKIIWPIILGLCVVGYMLWKHFDPREFAKIEWSSHMFYWLLIAIALLVLRHIAYAYRLRILSNRAFSWRKCIQLIFIWEFSSAVSPTALGGSAVAFFILKQEKLTTARTATIVLYTIVLDTFFFIATIPVLLAWLGPEIIRPDLTSFDNLDGWGWTFIGAYIFMAIYGAFIFYGLWVNPKQFKRMIVWLTRIKFLRRYRDKAIQTGDEIIVASRQLTKSPWSDHIRAFLATAVAWSFRFLLLSALIVAIVGVSVDVHTQAKLYARLQSMFVIMAFSPTPGGSGFAEYVFGGFLKDYVPEGIALIVAFIWRLIAYYAYLIAGAIIIPGWLNNIIRRRKKRRLKSR